jgi:hypothetical protein
MFNIGDIAEGKSKSTIIAVGAGSPTIHDKN